MESPSSNHEWSHPNPKVVEEEEEEEEGEEEEGEEGEEEGERNFFRLDIFVVLVFSLK